MNESLVKRPIARRVPALRWLLLAAVVAGISGCGQRSGDGIPPATEETWYFAVEGMSCEGCVSTVTAAVQPLPGVESVKVSLQDKKATVRVTAAQASHEAIVEAIQKAGYKAKEVR